MTIAHYGLRLPAEYDVAQIRTRANEIAGAWNEYPELYFKAFLLRERGRYGANENHYSSLYLWRANEAFRDFLTEQFDNVVNSFGRPPIHTWFTLDARAGRTHTPRFVNIEEINLARDSNLTKAYAAEIERNRRAAEQPGTVAAVVGIDTQQWKFARFILSENEPTGREQGATYQVLHLSRPLLETLPH
jgi:hypothetical protein